MKKNVLLCALMFISGCVYSQFSLENTEDCILVKSGGTEFRIMKNSIPDWGRNSIFYIGEPSAKNGISFVMTSLEGIDGGTGGPMQLLTGKGTDVKIVTDNNDFKTIQVEYELFPLGKSDKAHRNGRLELLVQIQRDISAAVVRARAVALKDDFTLKAFTGSFGQGFENYQTNLQDKISYAAGDWTPFPKSEYLLLGKGENRYILAADSAGRTKTPGKGVAIISDINEYKNARLHKGEYGELKILLGTAKVQKDIDNALTLLRTFSSMAAQAAPSVPTVISDNALACNSLKKKPVIDGNFTEWDGKAIERGLGHDRPRDSITWHGEGDLSLKTWLAFDKDYLYVACRVNDDYFEQKNSDGSIWAGDMLQLSFDPLCEKAVTDNFIDIGFSAADTPAVWCWQHPDKKYIGDISKTLEFKSTRDPQGINYEIAIPWEFLKPFDLRRGKIGFSLAALDNDGHGVENWIGLTEGVAGGKNPELYYDLLIGSSEDIIAAAYGYSKPMLLFNSEVLLSDEQNTFSAAILVNKEEIPSELMIELVSGKSRLEFSRELHKGFNSFTFTIPAARLEAGNCKASVYMRTNGKKINELTSEVTFIDSAYILKQVDTAQSKYEELLKKFEAVQAKYGKAPYLASAVGLTEYFIPFVKLEASRKSVYRENQMRIGRTEIPLDSAYKLFVYPRANRNIIYINKLLEDSLQQADSILAGKEKPLSVPEIKKGMKPQVADGSFSIDGQKIFFLGPNTWTIHYTQIAGIGKCGFNFMDFNQLKGNDIVYKNEAFSIPKREQPFNGNMITEAENNGVYFFGRMWEGNKRLTEPLLVELEKQLESNSGASKTLDKSPNLTYFVTQSETFQREKDMVKAEEFFQLYLQKKFGDIKKLNSALGTAFTDFKEIKNKDISSAGSLKYEYFLSERASQVEMLKLFNEAKRKYFKTPFSTHFSTLNLYAYDPIMGAADYEQIWKNFDIIGWDGGIGPDDRHYAMRWSNDETLHCDLARSFYPDKPIANNEAHNIPGKHGAEISSEYVYAALFQPFLHGRNAAVLWLWDIDGHGAWGNHIFTRANTHHAAARIALDLRRLVEFITPFQKLNGPVAVLYSLPSMVEGSYIKNFISVYEGVFFTGFPVKFVSEAQVEAGKLGDYKLLIVPGAKRVSEKTFQAIAGFSKKGGKILLVGADSLGQDEYGKPVASREPVRKNMLSCPFSTPENYFSRICSLLDEMKLKPAIEVRDFDGKRPWAVEYRNAKMEDGTELLYVLNLSKDRRKVKIETEKQLFDLITDRKIENKLELKPLDIYLLKIGK